MLAAMGLSRNKKILGSIIIVIIMVSAGAIFYLWKSEEKVDTISIYEVLSMTSSRRSTEDVVIASDTDPFYSLISTPLACWYDISPGAAEPSGLKPFLIANDGELDNTQERFLTYYGANSLLLLGDVHEDGTKLTGDPAKISLELAKSLAGLLQS